MPSGRSVNFQIVSIRKLSQYGTSRPCANVCVFVYLYIYICIYIYVCVLFNYFCKLFMFLEVLTCMYTYKYIKTKYKCVFLKYVPKSHIHNTSSYYKLHIYIIYIHNYIYTFTFTYLYTFTLQITHNTYYKLHLYIHIPCKQNFCRHGRNNDAFVPSLLGYHPDRKRV